MNRVARILPIVAPLVLGGCVWIFRGYAIESVARSRDSVTVQTPVRAHLTDGSTVIYRDGVTISRDTLRGTGIRSDLTLSRSVTVSRVPLDSVAAMESIRTVVNAGASVMTSLVASTAIPVALFGYYVGRYSCPSFYTEAGGTPVLVADGFSSSIAPQFEARDVDLLGALPDDGGAVRVEVRNEALETDYINHLALVEVRHRETDLIVQDQAGEPLAVRDLRAPSRARDGAGRDVRRALRATDQSVFRTERKLLAAVEPGNVRDFVDLSFPAGDDAGTALVLRLQNSLFHRELLYDVMLGDQGARALDWLGEGLEHNHRGIVEWYDTTMGLRVLLSDGDEFREIARIRDTGAIGWKEVGIAIPAAGRDSVRIRLSFVADNWRIDRASLARQAARPPVLRHSIARVLVDGGAEDSSALAAMAAPDGRYLSITPGQRFVAEFDTDGGRTSASRTFLLQSQGYYIEWVRAEWIRTATAATPFEPSEATLLTALRRWHRTQRAVERRFAASAVP